jgi:hypothetical protein
MHAELWQPVEAAHQLTALILSSNLLKTFLCHSSGTMQPRSVLQPIPRIFIQITSTFRN